MLHKIIKHLRKIGHLLVHVATSIVSLHNFLLNIQSHLEKNESSSLKVTTNMLIKKRDIKHIVALSCLYEYQISSLQYMNHTCSSNRNYLQRKQPIIFNISMTCLLLCSLQRQTLTIYLIIKMNNYKIKYDLDTFYDIPRNIMFMLWITIRL